MKAIGLIVNNENFIMFKDIIENYTPGKTKISLLIAKDEADEQKEKAAQEEWDKWQNWFDNALANIREGKKEVAASEE